jgi:preprotein translocase subunit SecD
VKPVVLALIAISLAIVLSSCGGGGDGQPSPTVLDEPSPTVLDQAGVRVVLEADFSLLPPGTDIDDAMRQIAEILERRTRAFDTGAFEIEVEGTNRLSVRLRGIGIEEARELLVKMAQLEFRKPVLNESGNIVCETADGSTYTQPYQPGLFVEDETNDIMTCPPNEEGTTGFVQWEPATGTDSQGLERVLTGSFLKANSRVVDPPPTVVIEFTGEGSLLFEQITTELVGLPLGIFLDEELIGAPMVSQPITGGNSTITGLDFDEARTLSIQLNTGALPAPLRVISIEETP